MNNIITNSYKLIIIGAGAAGMMAAITAARNGHKVLLLEKLPKIAAKLKATGGGRCNLSNTLSNETFMEHFGRDGRFMTTALERLDHSKLQDFFDSIGVQTHAPDGFRIFPVGHDAKTIITAMHNEMIKLGVDIKCNQKAEQIHYDTEGVNAVSTTTEIYNTKHIIIATGGKGYPKLGAEGDGYRLASSVGHTITTLYPAMMPLKTKESWVSSCRADTIAKVKIVVDIKKYKRLQAQGDLIFTKSGIRGPVVLDFSREITPLIDKFGEVPILLNLTKGMNEEQIREHFKKQISTDNLLNTLDLLCTLLPKALAEELCKLSAIDPSLTLGKQLGSHRDKLIKTLAWTPLTIIGHDGFDMAMITRGGISLKEINPQTMQSKKLQGLYFCGEVVNLDGPCGGYNLQWAFSSGFLAGADI